MQLRGGEATTVPQSADSKKPKMKARRNSFGDEKKPTVQVENKPAEKTKKAPKSVNGIDNLTLAISSIKLDNEPTKKSTVSVKVIEKPSAEKKAAKEEKNDDEKPIDLENVTESYVSSMKELLLSFDKSLHLHEQQDKQGTSSLPTSPLKKDNSLPLPRLLLTGGASLPSITSPPAKKVEKGEKEGEDDDDDKTEKKSGPASSTTPIVDVKEKEGGNSTPTRRVRAKGAPAIKDGEAHIARSSKQAFPRRRGFPDSFDGSFAAQAGYTDLSGNLVPDATLDSLLGISQQDFMTQKNSNNANSMDFYGFPDLNSATFNMNFAGMGQNGGDAVYNAEQGFTAESTPELVDCGEPGLGVYSSPAGPVTPPAAGTPYSTNQNLLASPYATPPDLSQQANGDSFNGGWSAPSSSIGSPPEQYMPSPAMSFHKLSPHTIHEMKRVILLPLAQEPSLVQFTPLIAAASQRLDEGHIFCLRDLEKFLLFKSQEMAPNSHLFVNFLEKFLGRCQQSIPYIEAAGGELTRPNDTSYYDGYFLDMLSQHKDSLGSDVPQMTILRRDQSSSSAGSVPKKSVPVMGKVGKNTGMGQQHHINMNSKMQDQILAALLDQASQDVKLPEEFYQSHVPTQFPLSPISDNDRHSNDENQESSAAGQVRRKRMTVQKPSGGHVCMHRDEETGIICGKKYNRPCDLKKHGKTHSRPHKCSEPTCLYNEKGFPTEKERDRHETDRHTEAPKMWHCEFPPCPYKSKRESNCKQHMEKQHDYVYERSKHNPRNPNGNADPTKKKVEQQNMTLGSNVPVVKSNMVNATHKPNAPSIFETGMSTPPSDVYSNLFSAVPSSVEGMYMTPSPESSHTYRTNSIPRDDGNWDPYAQWQQMGNNNMMGYGMTTAE